MKFYLNSGWRLVLSRDILFLSAIHVTSTTILLFNWNCRKKMLWVGLLNRWYAISHFLFINHRIIFNDHNPNNMINEMRVGLSLDSSWFLSRKLRMIHNDGTVAYENGDVTNEPVGNPTANQCQCGFKHWWKGIAYDNPPQQVSSGSV